MFIQQGKQEGWLQADLGTTYAWLRHNGVKFEAVGPRVIDGRGTALVASEDIESLSPLSREILTVPKELVLSSETVNNHALFDQDLRQVIESLGDWGRTARGAILTFLLYQASLSCPSIVEKIGVRCEFTQYVKTLPCEMLPTFWNAEELHLLDGTTLAPAVSSKMIRLHKEYDELCAMAANTKWFRLVQTHLDFDDWMQVDAMFRSRALEFHGSCMIPGMDLASHAPGEATNVTYDKTEDSYVLRLIHGKSVKKDEEIAITYGDEKGACEMLFSYGFIDHAMDTAETLFLSLSIPMTDASRAAKARVANCAPGFKLIDIADTNDSMAATPNSHAEIDWKGDFVWLLCVSEDDGLSFQLAQTIDGEEEICANFRGQDFEGADGLRRLLAQDKLWDVFRLRAIVILQQRVFEQLQALFETQESVELTPHGDGTPIRTGPWDLALKLRRLEFELLEKAYEVFEAQKIELADSPVVREYLTEMNRTE
ncbi:SET domain-containing protein [Dissoconium aciculare CBS 342.82]|uniref:SET domain-containing protein n=1 Tax=Dissoconium aciculare CBS 342.82 TaxID=1314786 RepID=A0A6J3M0U5_9PEZI|nr:SET domain-containing protein [Dissoconium aciculare CBS 342.82]KAF1821124.1 SET domain-containing protein [Dissoconium aciculare CBS 342.82]